MTLALVEPAIDLGWDQTHQATLLNEEIVLQTRSHSLWGGAVTAQMYLPLDRSQIWSQLINYPRWVNYFPSLMRSQVLSAPAVNLPYKRLYQVAGKTLFCFTAQVEIYLKVFEAVHPSCHQLQFQFERGSFHDFTALLKLQDFNDGTLLTYSVQATPTIPIPTQIIQEGIRIDLPANMRSMRRVLCAKGEISR